MNSTFAEDSLSKMRFLKLLEASSMTNMILSFPLNGYVIQLILSSSRGKVASDLFSLNLALSEFLYALSAVWIGLHNYLKWQIGQSFFAFFLGLLYTARPLFQCCICVEYYMGVIHPVLYLRFKPLRYRVGCCCVLWLFTLLSCMYVLYTYEMYLYLYAYFFETLLFFFVMLFCCLSVLWALKRPGPGDGDKRKKTSNAMKRRAFKIILIIMTFMTVNLFFSTATIPLQCCLEYLEFYSIFFSFVSVTLTTGFIQPILYLHRSGKLPNLCKVKSPLLSYMCFIDCRKHLMKI